MTKTIEEYMKLPYTIELTPDEGRFFVKVKELPGCMSFGETQAEALEMITDAMRGWLEVALEDQVAVPLPEAMQGEKYSGRFALRLPKSLHAKLAEAAEREGVSLNQYMVTLLAENNALQEMRSLMKHTPVYTQWGGGAAAVHDADVVSLHGSLGKKKDPTQPA